jgi:hypothetical protein
MLMRLLLIVFTTILAFDSVCFGQSMDQESEIVDVESQQLPSYEKKENRAYHFGIGLAKPISIGNEFNHYDIMFNTPSVFPQLWGEYYFFSFAGFDLGVRTKIAYYTDKGNPAQGINKNEFPLKRDLEESEIARDQRSTLSLIPMQASLALNFNPFSSRYIGLQAWYGIQMTYVQNAMGGVDNSNNQEQSEEGDSETYLNSGFNQEMVVGLALPLKISQFDSNTAHSLKVYGIEGLYLTPFLEIVTTFKNKLGSFDRKVAGLMITVDTNR